MAKKPTQWELLLDEIPPPLRNKFILVTAFLVVWMLFFDNNSAISQFKLRNTLTELKEKQAYFKKEIKEAEKAHEELFTNDKTREKFAREHYYMKKENEDVFVIEKKK